MPPYQSSRSYDDSELRASISGKANKNGSNTEAFVASQLSSESLVVNSSLQVPGTSPAHNGTIGPVPNVGGANNVGFAKTNRFNGTDYALLQYDGGAVNVNASSGASLSFTKDHVNKMVCGQDGNWTIQTQLTMDGVLNSRLIQPIDNNVRSVGTSALNYAAVHTREVNSNDALDLRSNNVSIIHASSTENTPNTIYDGDGEVNVKKTLKVDAKNEYMGVRIGSLKSAYRGIDPATGLPHNSFNSAQSVFAHASKFNQWAYALNQWSSGLTMLNAATNVDLLICKSNEWQLKLTGGNPGSPIEFVLRSNFRVTNNTTFTIESGSTFTNLSDDRLKHNETPIVNALETIRQINPLQYDQDILGIPNSENAEPTGENAPDSAPTGQTVRSFGVIAQELQPLIPEAVKEGRYLSVDYNMVFMHLLAAVKELDQVVHQQAARIQILENNV